MTDVIAEGWGRATRNLGANPHAAKTFLIAGRAPSAGEVFRNPDLASSLHLIAEKGAAGFYEGKTAEAILARSRARRAAP